jgi:hypothetical protein
LSASADCERKGFNSFDVAATPQHQMKKKSSSMLPQAKQAIVA